MRLKWATMKRLQWTEEATNFLLPTFVFPVAFPNHLFGQWQTHGILDISDFKYSLRVYSGLFTKVCESTKN